MTLEDPITCVASIVHRLAADLSHADRQEVISAALVRISTGTEHALSAVRWSLADWLRDQTTIPAPVDDLDLKRELGRARRAVRSASEDELASWDKLLGRMTERERLVAERLAAGFGRRDIAADCGLSDGTVTRTVTAIRRRLGDSVLWFPILDALYSLPNTKAERAEYVTDLSEYRRVKVARRSAPKVTGETTAQRQPIFTTWFVPCHEKRQAPMAWYPGQPIKRWEPTAPIRSPWAEMPTWAWLIAKRAERATKRVQPAHSKTETAVDNRLNDRELRDLQSGRRWYFEHKGECLKSSIPPLASRIGRTVETYNVWPNMDGTLLSVPVIRREYSADGMFRRHVQ